MASQGILRLLLTLTGLAASLAVGLGASAGEHTNTPFGLAGVTTPDLTPDRFLTALPRSFHGVQLEPSVIGATEDHLHSFPTMSQEYFYIGPTDALSVWVIVNDLGAEPSVASAIARVADETSAQPRFAIEEQDTTPAAEVPYLLVRQDNSVHAVVWGARDGDWVFTVLTHSMEMREEFIRVVVANLNAAKTKPTAAESEAPPYLPPVTPTPGPTVTPRPTPTPTATAVPTPTSTVATGASSGAPNTTGGPGSGATTGPVVRVENDLDLAYGEIYTVPLHCEEVQVRWQGLVDGSCTWPLLLPPNQAECIQDDGVMVASGYHYLCKSRYDTANASHPNEITVYNAPEAIYSIEVRCTNVTESFGVISGDCDVPWLQSGMNDCIESDQYTWGDTRIFLCKP